MLLITDSEHRWYDIYYDTITSKKIPMVQQFGDRKDEPTTARFGHIPCSCQNLTCGCCTQFNIRLFNYNKKGLIQSFLFSKTQIKIIRNLTLRYNILLYIYLIY